MNILYVQARNNAILFMCVVILRYYVWLEKIQFLKLPVTIQDMPGHGVRENTISVIFELKYDIYKNKKLTLTAVVRFRRRRRAKRIRRNCQHSTSVQRLITIFNRVLFVRFGCTK